MCLVIKLSYSVCNIIVKKRHFGNLSPAAVYRMLQQFFRVLILYSFVGCSLTWAQPLDSSEYQPVSGIRGTLNSMGSDSLNNLLILWSEAFQRYYPAVNIQVQGTGSSIAPTALLEGTANLGPMSREMRSTEKEIFASRYGYYPTAIPIALDVIAVYVNKDNPLTKLSMAQLDAIFSVSRRCGQAADIRFWGDLGLQGSWAKRDFERYSRHTVSGTYGFFKNTALCGGDFKADINEMPGSASVVNGVAGSINGIGYAVIGFKSAGVKSLAIDVAGQALLPNRENARSGSYPLVRTLYLYVNRHPDHPLSPLEAEFLKLIFSQEGQDIIAQDGYIPLPSEQLQQVRHTLGFAP